MRLKSIELNGFKTFATKSQFQFADEITVIVGPNGSGKSNIADAVRWVLGEQSYKMLRGKKTADMIFSGSDERSQAGMATATIVFDNSEGWLPIEFSEVSITRRAYRDGKNEYLINGQQVLLRDINELLAQSGLAERTYTIIGQGLVDAALALKAEERRNLFEEAAGIGLYKSRREEAERRLEKTRRNLERVEDILAELKPRLRNLKRQASRFEQHAQVKDDLQVLMREWYGHHWYRIQEQLQRAAQREKALNGKLQTARQKQAELDQKLSENQNQVQGLRARLNSWHRELSQQHAQREEITRELAVSQERIRSLKNQLSDLQLDGERLEEQKQVYQERIDQSQDEVERLTAKLKEARSQVNRLQKTIQERQEERAQLKGKLEDNRTGLASLEKDLSRNLAKQEERQEQIEKKKEQISSAEKSLGSAETELDKRKNTLKEIEDKYQEAVGVRRQAEQAVQEQREKISSGEEYRQELQEKQTNLQTRISRLSAELDVLQQAENKLAGYANGARLLLTEAREGKLSGALGALSTHLEVEERLERPIAAALGDYLDAVIVEGGRTSRRALDLLLARTTRGAILPLEEIRPPEPVTPRENLPGLIGVASELVEAPPRFRPAVDLLLGHVFIVEDKADIPRVLKDQPEDARAVTLQGEVFHVTGQVLAGNEGQPSTLSRSRQKKTWETKLAEAEEQMVKTRKRLQEVDRKLAELKEGEAEKIIKLVEKKEKEEEAQKLLNSTVLNVNQARQQMLWVTDQRQDLIQEIEEGEEALEELLEMEARFREKTTEYESAARSFSSSLQAISLAEEQQQMAHWETQLAVAERAQSDARERLGERRSAWEEVKQELEEGKIEIQQIQEKNESLTARQGELQISEETIKKEINELQELISSTEETLETAEGEQTELRKAEAEARKALNQSERQSAQAEIQHTRAEDKLESIQDRIREDLGLVELDYGEDLSGPTPLPLEGYVEKLPKVEEVADDLGQTIKEKRGQLRRLGAINPEARAEYQSVNQRFQFLTEQLSDLRKAEADIKEVIAELELLMEREFRKTFDAVAAKFREIFTRLFGGGEGRLVLSEPDDLSRSGVDIEARLPGRKTQGLSLLSGGERSLTAAALIFSLLKISPTPFCVLDEVDAMLDESNVARYRNLLRELSSETQFIVITHNRNTVQVADIIYGITMGEDSTSKVLSLKLEEVEEIIEDRV